MFVWELHVGDSAIQLDDLHIEVPGQGEHAVVVLCPPAFNPGEGHGGPKRCRVQALVIEPEVELRKQKWILLESKL